MECPVSIIDLSNRSSDKWYNLSALLSETINSLEQSLLSYNLKELSLDVKEDYPFPSDRDAVIEKTKLSVISETLDSLKILYNNLERWNGIVMRSTELYRGRDIDCKIRAKMEQLVNDCNDTFDSLNKNAKSPYDLEAILDPDYFKRSLKTHPTNDKHDRARLFIELAQSELGIIKESSKTNEMQKVILTFYLDKLKTLKDQITSSSLVTTTSTSKKKSKSSKSNEINKICETIRKCQRIIKDVYGLMKILTFKDYFNESHEIFNVINEKGCDAISDVYQSIERKKINWIKEDSENITRATCRSGALRRLNVILKLTKKLDSFKDDLESSYIILGLKHIATDTLRVNVAFGSVYDRAYDLTFKIYPPYKPRVDVPANFTRNDPVYEEIHEKPFNGLFIVYFHILEYKEYMDSLDWNPFQHRKPRELTQYLWHMEWLIEAAMNGNTKYVYDSFNQDELYKIILDLADHYLMTKQKIHYDRETLEYRFDRFKPLKLYKFPEIAKIFNSKRRYKGGGLREVLAAKFDGLISQLNCKVTNRGQLIVFERAMVMMKRSIYLFKIIRRDVWPYNKSEQLYNKLVEQAVNEYFYAAEIVVKLLDLLRPNRRVTFSFSANGPFTKKIDSIGLKVKDEFLETVNSQIKTLKIQIKDKEADLESVKHEKTQLKYLHSISNRTKSIPIKELEMTDEDNIEILREIVEEYEFTFINYGPSKVWYPAKKYVKQAVRDRKTVHPSGTIIDLSLNGGLPWKEHLFAVEKEMDIVGEIKFAIFQDLSKDWRVCCVPIFAKSFTLRTPLDIEWRGLRDEKLSQVSGIPDCIFVHATGLIGGARTREACVAMAVKTLDSAAKEESKDFWSTRLDQKCPKQSKVRIHVSAMLFSVTTLTFVILSVNTINTIGENQFNQGSYLTLTNDDANQPTNKRINPTSSNDDSKENQWKLKF
uniref:Uncharacterized protein n=1 Tax=Tetranychus urticae TaxID=32264 RepID=T1KBZ1_TETUR